MSNTEILANIANNLRRLREELELSYSELARRCSFKGWKCYPANIEQIESQRHMPNSALLYRISRVLGCSTDELLDTPRGTRKLRRAS